MTFAKRALGILIVSTGYSRLGRALVDVALIQRAQDGSTSTVLRPSPRSKSVCGCSPNGSNARSIT